VQTQPLPPVPGVFSVPRDIEDVVPLPPAPAPAYPSLAAYHADLRARLATLHLRELQLTTLANPRGRRRKVILGSIVAGVGMVGLYVSTVMASGSDVGPPSVQEERRGLAAAGISVAMLLTGAGVIIWGVAYRPYHRDLRETRLIRRQAQQELERTLAPARSAYIQLSLHSVGLHVRF
jgi:hypothetical protein